MRHSLPERMDAAAGEAVELVMIAHRLIALTVAYAIALHALLSGFAVTDVAAGWATETLAVHLSRQPEGVRYPARVLTRQLAELPEPPTPSHRSVPWCGHCEDPQSRTITVTLSNGTEAAAFCPRCSPQEALKNQPTSTAPRGGR